ncbi:MAG: hypothetical protein KBD12_01425 [Candidatus Pacebacteria bacterium]|nr:hypothetical protein [Candidatus Paceibacterota bacterium]
MKICYHVNYEIQFKDGRVLKDSYLFQREVPLEPSWIFFDEMLKSFDEFIKEELPKTVKNHLNFGEISKRKIKRIKKEIYKLN